MYKILGYAMSTGHRLDEALSKEDTEILRKQLAYPDIRPCVFDETFEAWLYRIGLWGKIEITYNDPEYKIKNRVITQDKFIKKVGNPDVNRILGQWSMDRKNVTKMEMFREYVGMDGKKYRESFIIEVTLNPGLRK